MMNQPKLFKYLRTLPVQKYRGELKRYMLLLFIPIFFLAILFAGIWRVTSLQLENRARNIASRFSVQIGSVFHDIEMVDDLVLNDSIISRHLQGDSREIYRDYTLIQNQLNNMVQASSTVAHIYIVREDTKQIISDTGLISPTSFSYFLKEIGIGASAFDSIGTQTQFSLLNKNRTAPYGVRKLTGENGETICTLIVTLDMNYFLDMFRSQNAALCAIFNDDVCISSYLLPINPALFGGDFQWTNPRHVERLLHKSVTSVYAAQDQFTTLVALDNAEYQSPLRVVIAAFVLYAVVTLFLSFLYLYRISKRRYDGIAQIAAALPERYAGDDSYDHIYEKIHESLTDFRQQNTKLIAIEKERGLRHLLQEAGSQSVPENLAHSAGLTVSDKSFFVLSFFVDHISEPAMKRARGENTHDFLNMLVRTTVEELAQEREYHTAFTSDRHIYICVLSSPKEESLKKHILSLARKAVDIISSSYDLTVYAAISHEAASVDYLSDAYQETVELHSFARSINSSNHVLSSDQLRTGANAVLSGDFVRQEQILLNSILARRYDLIPSMVESILQSHVLTLRKNYTLVRSRLQSIANDLIEGIRISCLSGLDPEAAAEQISAAVSVDELIQAAREVYNRMNELHQQKPEIEYVEIAVSYMTENLSDQNLNVAQICEATGISVQRLTRMFQEKYNMPVGEYMNTLRIEMAKKMLVETDITVSQIALDVGYTNINTLTRNFKKREGITPTDYRHMQQAHD